MDSYVQRTQAQIDALYQYEDGFCGDTAKQMARRERGLLQWAVNWLKCDEDTDEMRSLQRKMRYIIDTLCPQEVG